MLEVTVAITVRDNTSEGAIVSVGNIETVPVNHTDEVAMWLQAKQATKRLVEEEVFPKAMVQLEQWQMEAEQRQRGT